MWCKNKKDQQLTHVYVNVAYLYDKSNEHSYVCGVFSDIDVAIKCANKEHINRRNKYNIKVFKYALDALNSQNYDTHKKEYLSDNMVYETWYGTEMSQYRIYD